MVVHACSAMLLIASVTVGVALAITENQAPARTAAPTNAHP